MQQILSSLLAAVQIFWAMPIDLKAVQQNQASSINQSVISEEENIKPQPQNLEKQQGFITFEIKNDSLINEHREMTNLVSALDPNGIMGRIAGIASSVIMTVAGSAIAGPLGAAVMSSLNSISQGVIAGQDMSTILKGAAINFAVTLITAGVAHGVESALGATTQTLGQAMTAPAFTQAAAQAAGTTVTGLALQSAMKQIFTRTLLTFAGDKLGVVGSNIVGGVITGALTGDPTQIVLGAIKGTASGYIQKGLGNSVGAQFLSAAISGVTDTVIQVAGTKMVADIKEGINRMKHNWTARSQIPDGATALTNSKGYITSYETKTENGTAKYIYNTETKTYNSEPLYIKRDDATLTTATALNSPSMTVASLNPITLTVTGSTRHNNEIGATETYDRLGNFIEAIPDNQIPIYNDSGELIATKLPLSMMTLGMGQDIYFSPITPPSPLNLRGGETTPSSEPPSLVQRGAGGVSLEGGQMLGQVPMSVEPVIQHGTLLGSARIEDDGTRTYYNTSGDTLYRLLPNAEFTISPLNKIVQYTTDLKGSNIYDLQGNQIQYIPTGAVGTELNGNLASYRRTQSVEGIIHVEWFDKNGVSVPLDEALSGLETGLNLVSDFTQQKINQTAELGKQIYTNWLEGIQQEQEKKDTLIYQAKEYFRDRTKAIADYFGSDNFNNTLSNGLDQAYNILKYPAGLGNIIMGTVVGAKEYLGMTDEWQSRNYNELKSDEHPGFQFGRTVIGPVTGNLIVDRVNLEKAMDPQLSTLERIGAASGVFGHVIITALGADALLEGIMGRAASAAATKTEQIAEVAHTGYKLLTKSHITGAVLNGAVGFLSVYNDDASSKEIIAKTITMAGLGLVGNPIEFMFKTSASKALSGGVVGGVGNAAVQAAEIYAETGSLKEVRTLRNYDIASVGQSTIMGIFSHGFTQSIFQGQAESHPYLTQAAKQAFKQAYGPFVKVYAPALIVFLDPVTSVQAYERDVHLDVTNYLAIKGGMSPQDAVVVAKANQWTDDDPKRSPWASEEARRLYHFVTPARLAELRKDAFDSLDAEKFGTYLHAFQDSFSHAGYGPKVGHLFKRHEPDKTYNDPEKAMLMEQGTYQEILRFQSARGYDVADRFRELYERMNTFNRAKDDDVKKGALAGGVILSLLMMEKNGSKKSGAEEAKIKARVKGFWSVWQSRRYGMMWNYISASVKEGNENDPKKYVEYIKKFKFEKGFRNFSYTVKDINTEGPKALVRVEYSFIANDKLNKGAEGQIWIYENSDWYYNDNLYAESDGEFYGDRAGKRRWESLSK
ncbi:MAG: hypothetical protein HYZ67_05010 [Chlamydiae bacterium]|nr:hypothetical protein [Chlamydiota bacterium]